MRANLLLLFAMLFSVNSYAAYTYSNDGGDTVYSSPEAICTFLLPKAITNFGSGYHDVTYSHFASMSGGEAYSDGTIAYCFYNRVNKGGDASVGRHSALIKRFGSPDPDPQPQPNACSSAPSAIISRGPYGSVVQSDGKNYVVAPSPSSVCSDNCLYDKPESSNTKDCFLLSTDSQTGFCNYGFTLFTDDKGDGKSCAVNTSIPYEKGSSLNDTDDGSGDGSGGDGDGSGGDGDGSGSGGDGSGDGSGSGSDSFKNPGSPDFDHREEERKRDIESKYRGFSTTFQESVTYTTIKSSFQNIGDPGASCPVATFDIFNTNIVFDSHCALFDSVAPTIGFASMAAWALVALLIILSA